MYLFFQFSRFSWRVCVCGGARGRKASLKRLNPSPSPSWALSLWRMRPLELNQTQNGTQILPPRSGCLNNFRLPDFHNQNDAAELLLVRRFVSYPLTFIHQKWRKLVTILSLPIIKCVNFSEHLNLFYHRKWEFCDILSSRHNTRIWVL